MSLAYGVTPEGFVAKPLSVVHAEVDTGMKKILGDSAGTEPDGTIPLESAAGQLKVLIVDGFAEQWDGQQAIYSSLDPNQATDASQDAVCAITGTLREAARFSSVTETCTGDPGTVLLLGRQVKVADTGALFSSQAEATIVVEADWAGATPYLVGDRVTNNGNVYQCITAGTSAGSGGPTTTSEDITDNTVHWMFLGVGTGSVDVSFKTTVAGPIGALAGTLVEISTPASGWSSAINLLDAVAGRTLEANAILRARRDADLAAPGNTTADAIRANILKLNEGSTDPAHEPPTSCRVFINDTDDTDPVTGLPPHSVEVMVQGGTDADIALEVWNSVGAGTDTFGNQTSTITDSLGNSQTVSWTRPAEIDLYADLTVRYDVSTWPQADAADRVTQAALSALLTFANPSPVGRDVRSSPLAGAVMFGPSQTDDAGAAVAPAAEGSLPIPGLVEVDPVYIGLAPSPVSSAAVSIGVRQVAVFDSTRITIHASAEEP